MLAFDDFHQWRTDKAVGALVGPDQNRRVEDDF
jgi:hypothetical protein